VTNSTPSRGIYLNTKTLKAYRAPTSIVAPTGSEWVLLDADTMIGLQRVHELAAQRNLVPDAQQIEWTGRTDGADT
jgi:hypothetical protein